MDTEQNESEVVVRNGEVLAVLDDGVLVTVDLNCDEFAIVGYALLARAA